MRCPICEEDGKTVVLRMGNPFVEKTNSYQDADPDIEFEVHMDFFCHIDDGGCGAHFIVAYSFEPTRANSTWTVCRDGKIVRRW